MSSAKVYWVIKGREPGLYHDWQSCLAQVHKFSGATYKSFRCEQDYLDAKAQYELRSIPKDDSDNASFKKGSFEASKESDSTKEETVVYTDGSCQLVGAKSVGGSGVWYGDKDERNISQLLPGDRQTNQRAELYAVLLAMQQHLIDDNKTLLAIKSDSKYVVLGMTDWVFEWQTKNEWYRIQNGDLWKHLVTTRSKLQHGVSFEHVFAHTGIEGNEGADRLAKAAVQQCRHGQALKSQRRNGQI